MAETTLEAGTSPAKNESLTKILKLAETVRATAREAECVLMAIEQLDDDMPMGGDIVAASHIETMDRMMVLTQLAAKLNAKAVEICDEIEAASLSDSMSPGADWDDLLARYLAVEAKPDEQSTDDDIDEAGDLVAALIETPAPTPAALAWKLRYLLESDKGYTRSWSAELVAPVLADCDRYLGRLPEAAAAVMGGNA